MTAAVANSAIPLGSLVFHCEVDERTSNPRDSQPPKRSIEQLAQGRERLRCLIAPADNCAAKLLRDVQYFVKEERDPDAILLATKLSAVGYSVNVRTALGGGPACFRNLRHEFLTVRLHGAHEGMELIVEPRFREHFLIPHPSEDYSDLLSHAPDVFVGTGARLVPVVQMLCALMAESFERKGLTLPPWRRTQSMLSKWLPNRARDTCFSRASAPPQHVCEDIALTGTARLPAAASGGHGAGAGHNAYYGGFTCGSGNGAAVHSIIPAALPLTRISDPLWLTGGKLRSEQQPQQQPGDSRTAAQSPQRQQAGAVGHPGNEPAQAAHDPGTIRRVDSGYGTMGFIPFGGCGGCSSDTEGPSPPAGGVLAATPRLGRPQMGSRPAPSTGAMPQAAAAAMAAAAGTGFCPGSSSRKRQSSLLATHLQGQGQALGTRAVLHTLAPTHWGDAPIHIVRMGFQVAEAAGAGRGSTGCGGRNQPTVAGSVGVSSSGGAAAVPIPLRQRSDPLPEQPAAVVAALSPVG